MTHNPPAHRSSATRETILEAMAHLASERRYAAITIVDLIDRAGIGRSTFYEHFGNKDQVLLALLDPILLQLANAASNRAPRPALQHVVRHVWERRQLFRVLLGSRIAARLEQRLSDLILERRRRADPGQSALLAAATASGQLAMLRSWTGGAVPVPVPEFAQQLILFSSPQ